MTHDRAFLIRSAIIKIKKTIRFDQFTNENICSEIEWMIILSE